MFAESSAKEKLLKKLPKKYHERVEDFYSDDLTEDIDENGKRYKYKYMLTLTKGWVMLGELDAMPCRNMKEAIDFIRKAEQK